MDEQNPRTGPEQTTPYDLPLPPPAAPATPASAPARGRKGFAAAVLAGALVVGGGAGVGGAALWAAYDDEPASTSTENRDGVTIPAVATADEEAPAGSVEEVAQRVLPAVVKIDVAGVAVGGAGPQQAGSGSGVVLTPDGQILTNEHVVALAAEGGEITVSFIDGSRAPAEVLGTDPLTDTAVLQAEGVEDLATATIGQSGALDVGEQVVAIGSPFGLESTVTSGIVSALDRPVDVGSDGQGNTTTYPAIQTDAAINPGNSGGPLVNMDGQVIGINSSIRTAAAGPGSASGSIGLGFAIPIDEVLPIVEQMANGETPTHARLGITVSDAVDEGSPLVLGALVREVGDDSTAAEAGIRSGDVVTKVDDVLIGSADSLVATIRGYRPGDEVRVTVDRAGEEKTLELVLDTDAEDTADRG